MVLQLKKGWLDPAYFSDKFNVDIHEHWQGVWQEYVDEGYVEIDDTPDNGRIRLTREGLLRADSLLPAFFEEEHQGVRYT